jgi:2-methylcitrate dehydratase PrpD
MDLLQMLVRNVLNTEYENLPNEAIEFTKLSILDTIGCMVAGAHASGCDALREQVTDWGGKEESSIMIFGEKVPCPNAALVNSTMARALDFDAVWERGLHMSATSVPTILAVAELRGNVSGKQFLSALIAGEDLAARVHLATSDYHGFEPTGVCGVLGVAAMTGKILGLDERQMGDAVAIAFNRSAGSFQPNIDGALLVRVMQGLASRSGIEAALLAKRGITGGEKTLQGVYGYFHLFSNDVYNAEILTDGLGRTFPGTIETTFKKFPSCGGTITAIEATLELVTTHNIRPDEVDEITVDTNPHFYNTLGRVFTIGANPQVDAQFSYQYSVANAVVRRRFSLEDITPEGITDPEVLSMAKKVRPRINPELEKESSRGTIVGIKRRDGRQYSRKILYPRGSKQNRISREDVVEKFRSCMQFAQMPPLTGNVQRITRTIEELENVQDIRELIRILITTMPKGGERVSA